jgi:hypothetical protein
MFIENANKIHNNKYDYSLVDYTNKIGKIKIICKYHGVFIQSAKNHMRGQNCPRCKNYISKSEIDFLNLMNVPLNSRQIYIGKYKIDGIKENIIYEFLGDYWHGNPQKFNSNDINERCNISYGKLFNRTFDKFKILKKMGYKIRYIWETEWKKYLKNKLSNPLILDY